MQTKKVIEGVVRFSRSSKLETACVCCEGAHIFGGRVEWEDHFNYLNKPGHSEDLVQEFIFQNKPSLEGKRIRLTIEVLGDRQKESRFQQRLAAAIKEQNRVQEKINNRKSK